LFININANQHPELSVNPLGIIVLHSFVSDRFALERLAPLRSTSLKFDLLRYVRFKLQLTQAFDDFNLEILLSISPHQMKHLQIQKRVIRLWVFFH